MADDDVTIGIKVDSEDAQKSIKSFENTAGKSLKNTEKTAKEVSSSFSGLSSSVKLFAGAAAAAFAAAGIAKGIKSVVDAAAKQQDAINSLNNALKITGEFSEQASKDIQDFASSLQQSSVVGDEVILQQFSLAKAFGATNDQAKLITKAALELSAATGKSLEEATRQVSKTLGGFAGELGEVNPKIKALTAEQLKNGEAAKILIDQYGGSALAQTRTFSGAIEQLQNIFGDLLEIIGDAIIKNPQVIAAFNAITSALKGFGTGLQGSSGFLSTLISGMVNLGASAIPLVIKGLSFLVSSLKIVAVVGAGVRNAVLSLVEALLNIRFVQNVINVLVDGFKGLQVAVLAVVSSILQVLNKIPGVAGSFDKVLTEISDTAVDRLNSIGEEVNFDPILDSIAVVKKELGPEATAQAFDAFTSSLDGAADAAERIADNIKNAKSEASSGAGVIASAIGAAVGGGSTAAAAAPAAAGAQKAGSKEAAKESGRSFIDIVSAGFDVAASAFNQTLGGGFVTSFSSIVESLSNIPEVFEQAFVKFDQITLKLADSFAESFQRVIARLPVFFKKAVTVFSEIGKILIDSLPAIVDGLVNGAVDLAIVIAQELIPRLISKLPDIFSAIIRQLPRLITGLAKSLGPIVRELAKALPELVEELANNIAPIVIALVEGLVGAAADIIVALVDELIVSGGAYRIAVAIAKGLFIELPYGLAKGILNALANLGSAVFSGLAGAFSSGIKFPKVEFNPGDFFSRLKDTLEIGFLEKLRSLLEKLDPSKAFGGGGPGGVVGGVVGGVRKALGFADGGTIPGGFPNDSFPARLTSGEEIVDTSTASKLREFLNRQPAAASSGPVVINLQVGEKQLASVLYDLNQRGFRTA